MLTSAPAQPSSRRIGARRPLRRSVTMVMPDGRERCGTTLDLGIEGLSLSIDRPVTPGSRCLLTLVLPLHSGPRELQVSAKSVYSSYSGPGDFRIGMVFTDPEALGEELLRDLLA